MDDAIIGFSSLTIVGQVLSGGSGFIQVQVESGIRGRIPPSKIINLNFGDSLVQKGRYIFFLNYDFHRNTYNLASLIGGGMFPFSNDLSDWLRDKYRVESWLPNHIRLQYEDRDSVKRKVSRYLDMLQNVDGYKAGIEGLAGLGESAVPALIEELPLLYVSGQSSAYAGELSISGTPKNCIRRLIFDSVDCVLRDITGIYPFPDSNSGVEKSLDSLRGWAIYGFYKYQGISFDRLN